MPNYLSGARLKEAVHNLRESRASGGFLNFLILKRSLVLSGGTPVGLSTRDDSFQQAITDLAWWPASDDNDTDRPFIDVFGSINAKSSGLKKLKYRSNGPADTLKNGAWSRVVQIETGPQSKTARLAEGYLAGLAAVTLLKDDQRAMPAIADAAAWYFRRRDVSGELNEGEPSVDVESHLVTAFCRELGLTEAERNIMFMQEPANAG